MRYKTYRTKDNKRVFHFIFEDQESMNRTFMRFSEFNESPIYKNRLFETTDILKYIPNYYSIVLGHNIPGEVCRKFHERYSVNFSLDELKIIKIVQQNNQQLMNDFYIIATFESDKAKYSAIDHEIAHALYYLNRNYNSEIRRIANKYTRTYKLDFSPMFKVLTYKQYDKTVWWDEIHAFLIDLGLGSVGFFYGRTFKEFIRRLFTGKLALHCKYKRIAYEMKQVYDKYTKELYLEKY